MSYLPFGQLGNPYNTCWNWDSFRGIEFSARADSWEPVYPDDRDYRCLPDPMPTEFQMFNLPPPCSESACSSNKSKNAIGVVAGIGVCPSCKRDTLAKMAGYAWDKPVPNPLLYPPSFRYNA